MVPAGLDWISALKSTDLRKLLHEPKAGRDAKRAGVGAPLRPEGLVPDSVAQITAPDFPGERLMVCLNPRLKEERARKREELLQATEATLTETARTVRRPGARLRGRDRINRRVGREANRRKVEKHFDITVTDDDLTWARNEEKIQAEARLDGIYIVRTSLDEDTLGADARPTRAWPRSARSAPSRPPASRCAPSSLQRRACPRPCVCVMLAWYVEWHLRRRLAPLLFEDDDREGARAHRTSPVQCRGLRPCPGQGRP